jgi:hypothetical protein
MLQNVALLTGLLSIAGVRVNDTTRIIAGRLYIEPAGISIMAVPSYSDPEKDPAPLLCKGVPSLFITAAGLDSLKAPPLSEWEGQFQAIANRTLGMARLQAQFGDNEWGKGLCFGGLDVRVYTSNATTSDVAKKVLRTGYALIGREYAAEKETRQEGQWLVTKLQWAKMFGDWGANARMEYFARSVNGRTIIILLMYDTNPRSIAGAKEVISSFKIERHK